MSPERHAQLEPLFNTLNPGLFGLRQFPPNDDDGGNDGTDRDLASIIFYGGECERDEDHFRFAIELGRRLERSGL